MAQITDMLAQLHKILKCKIALLFEDKLYFYPLRAYKQSIEHGMDGYITHKVEGLECKCIFYTEADAPIDEAALALIQLYIRNQLSSKNSSKDAMSNLLSGEYNFSDIAAIDKLLSNGKELYLIVISGIDVDSMESGLLEIIRNSVDIKQLAIYQGDIVAIAEEQNINEACGDLQKNILTELYIEAVIAIGGRIEQPQQLKELYNNCTQAILLRKSFGINQSLLDHQSMLLYKLIAAMDSSLKEELVGRAFNNRFLELMNNELELTIEEMFRNNLNLTDTSARLYIHRNTLLYRIEKIQKLTGFDLRKFEDSMIFKLAWLMYKEKNNS